MGSSGGGQRVVPPITASAAALPPFLVKTYDMVDDAATDGVVSWSKNSNSFVVWDVPAFARNLLPKYFKHSNFSSFVRQLNTYGFKKVDPDRWEFANEGFIRGHKHLLKSINRRRGSQLQIPSVSSSTEDGKDGMDEEVEMLKRDKNILMQELVRLRQQQQSTENQLQNVGQRVHLMEQRQKQMMSFLAKAMQSPGFVAQLVKQQNETNLHITGGNKKRRIPSQSEETVAHNLSALSPDGQIIKYQPLMNEAAKAMLRQIMSMSPSSRLESKFINANGFLIGNAPPPSVSDAGSSSDRMAVVTVSEAQSSAVRTEAQSSAGFLNQELVDMVFSKTKSGLQDLTNAQGVTLQQKNIEGVESGLLEYGDTVPGFVDAPIPVAADDAVMDGDADFIIDDIHKLPGINDVFWEQFLSSTTVTGDTDDLISANLVQKTVDDQDIEQKNEWGKLNCLINLTEQMGLLASTSKSG